MSTSPPFFFDTEVAQHIIIGFYSLFSVTEEPFVTSGGIILVIQFHSSVDVRGTRAVDGISLERQKGSSAQFYYPNISFTD